MKKLHLRTYGDKGKKRSSRTFCSLLLSAKSFHNSKKEALFRVTEYAALVDCKRCLNKLKKLK